MDFAPMPTPAAAEKILRGKEINKKINKEAATTLCEPTLKIKDRPAIISKIPDRYTNSILKGIDGGNMLIIGSVEMKCAMPVATNITPIQIISALKVKDKKVYLGYNENRNRNKNKKEKR